MCDKEILAKKRSLVRELFFLKHLNKSEIAGNLNVSRSFVHQWTKNRERPVTDDKRGWPKGRKRSRTDQEEERVIRFRRELEQDFFFGPNTIVDEHAKRYPKRPLLSRSFVARLVRQNFPMSRRGTLKAVREQNYPLKMIPSLGEIQEEADFMGEKYLHGSSTPLHFFTRVYESPFTLRLIKRVPDERSETALDCLTRDRKRYPLPDTLRLDNGFGFTASGKNPGIVSPFIQYLLSLKSL